MTIYQALKSFEPNVEFQEIFLIFYVKLNMIVRKRQKCPFDYSSGSEFWFWRFFCNLGLEPIKLKIHNLELCKMVIFEAPKCTEVDFTKKLCLSQKNSWVSTLCQSNQKYFKISVSILIFFQDKAPKLRLASTCLEQRGTPPLWIIVLDSNRRAHDGWRMEIGTGTNVYVYALYSIVIYEFTFTQFQSEDGRTSF